MRSLTTLMSPSARTPAAFPLKDNHLVAVEEDGADGLTLFLGQLWIEIGYLAQVAVTAFIRQHPIEIFPFHRERFTEDDLLSLPNEIALDDSCFNFLPQFIKMNIRPARDEGFPQ